MEFLVEIEPVIQPTPSISFTLHFFPLSVQLHLNVSLFFHELGTEKYEISAFKHYNNYTHPYFVIFFHLCETNF